MSCVVWFFQIASIKICSTLFNLYNKVNMAKSAATRNVFSVVGVMDATMKNYITNVLDINSTEAIICRNLL